MYGSIFKRREARGGIGGRGKAPWDKIDNHLTWNLHIDYAISKLNSRTSLLKGQKIEDEVIHGQYHAH